MDAIHVNFHRYQLFALSSNKLVERGHYYSTCRTIMKDFGGDIVRIREMRQAVSYFIKNAVVVDSKLDALGWRLSEHRGTRCRHRTSRMRSRIVGAVISQ